MTLGGQAPWYRACDRGAVACTVLSRSECVSKAPTSFDQLSGLCALNTDFISEDFCFANLL